MSVRGARDAGDHAGVAASHADLLTADASRKVLVNFFKKGLQVKGGGGRGSQRS